MKVKFEVTSFSEVTEKNPSEKKGKGDQNKETCWINISQKKLGKLRQETVDENEKTRVIQDIIAKARKQLGKDFNGRISTEVKGGNPIVIRVKPENRRM